MTVDPLLSLLIGALGAALIGLLGALIQSRREHARWIREQRLAAYLAYARESERILSDSPSGFGGHASVLDAQAATATLRLLGPERVFEAAFAFTVSAIRYAFVMGEPDANPDSVGATYQHLSDARQTFIDAARRELRIRG